MRVDVKKSLQELVVPKIRQVLAEVQTLKVEIRRLDEKIDLVRSELKAEMNSRDGDPDRCPLGEDRPSA